MSARRPMMHARRPTRLGQWIWWMPTLPTYAPSSPRSITKTRSALDRVMRSMYASSSSRVMARPENAAKFPTMSGSFTQLIMWSTSESASGRSLTRPIPTTYNGRTMDLHLQGRVAMVAAASKGLGRACSEALAAEGCRVSICARGDMDAVAGAELRVTADVSRAEDLARWHGETEARLGAVDILVTNTGGPPVGRFMELDEGKWMAGVESTLLSAIRLTRLVVPAMRARRWGRIIHLTSLVAKQPSEELTVSSTLRAGLSGLTRTLAKELGGDGITVNAILTGHVLTGRQEHLIEVRMKERGATREEVIAAQTAAIPL